MASLAFTALSSLATATTSSFPPNPKKGLSLVVNLSVNHEEKEREKEKEKGRVINLGRRGLIFSGCGLAAMSSVSLLSGGAANAAILEADDDVELLERVKKDRQKRIERQEVISSSKKETGYLQDLIYKLSKVGQAIENGDFSAAGLVLGQSANADWLKNVNIAFTKLGSSTEEKTEVNTFNSSLALLISSVDKRDIESSRLAFFTCASALEKWVGLTGLIGQLKGI